MSRVLRFSMPVGLGLLAALFIAALAYQPLQREAQAQPLPVGDIVIMAKYGGTEITMDGEDYLIMASDQLLATEA